MRSSDLSILQAMKKRVSEKHALVDMRAFGSRVRGNDTEFSDLDVFVELEQATREAKESIEDIAWEIGLEHLIHISPLVYSREDIERTPHRSSPIIQTILREGIRI